MDLNYCFDCNVGMLLGVFVVAFCVSCSSSKEAQEASVPVDDLPQIVREASRSQPDTTNDDNNNVELRYESNGTSVTIPIDPQDQDFVLELKGMKRQSPGKEESEKDSSFSKSETKPEPKPKPERPDSTILQDSLVQAEMAKRIKQVLQDFRRAQDLFYRRDYKGALEMVNKSLETQPTAHALGLKGSIFFMRDNMSSAKYYWNKAVQMNPDIPIPDIPELESLINKIKASEDQEEAEE